ncbi:MAG TPA: pyruvate, phosphate dikinase [Dehalococcoidia bacterium]|nr:pyruvate, phosphate dikinase [Dehalococcoidia bacterium]
MTTTSEEPAVATKTGNPPVYLFGDGTSDGTPELRNLLGGKGAGLAEMSRLGIPVPPGFTITTEVCKAYRDHGRKYPDELDPAVRAGIEHVERIKDAGFGDATNPLLVSVRSGARVSMPGMMDTVLNLGLNDVTVEGLAARSNNARFAYDSYRRFIAMYGDVVLGMERDAKTDTSPFETLLEEKKRKCKVELDTELDAVALKELVGEYKDEIKEKLSVNFPDDPWEQLWGAVGAVFDSWETKRAIDYREKEGYSSEWGTAVNVQAMVFGNLGDDCATGVVFTRDAATGAARLSGEYLVNAQGEDVVAGVRTPQPILAETGTADGGMSFEELMPDSFTDLAQACSTLEQHFREMQDIEFTVQQGRLWILQTRSGKRTGLAMVKIAVDFVDEGMIDEETAVRRQDPEKLTELFHRVLDPDASREPIATGLAASPGAAVGRVVFSADEAEDWSSRDERVVLVRTETSPDDIRGMIAAEGILTVRGGTTSHAAVVARGMGKCCVSGCGAMNIDYQNGRFTVTNEVGTLVVERGDTISLDGSTGEVMLGELPTLEPVLPAEYQRLMAWTDASRVLGVRANADTPEDAALARSFGAEGIGLCRTEHMFFGKDRILAVRRMICAENAKERSAALNEILPMQREDFTGILRAMAGFPVTIRLLDPPLHEFLPNTEDELMQVARALEIDMETMKDRVEALHEVNPMLGHRGVRLAVTFPEIYEVQSRAIIEATGDLLREGVEAIPEIMVPLVSSDAELASIRACIDRVAQKVIKERGIDIAYTIGTMIELPRACVTADRIAEHAEFFSFGTNDLTQTTFGLSRDDSARFLPAYREPENPLLEHDPFVELDREGVGVLVRIGIERGRSTKPDLKVGICGEHGGNPASVAFCHEQGLNYVSCSPYRVPIARLAAAQAALANGD